MRYKNILQQPESCGMTHCRLGTLGMRNPAWTLTQGGVGFCRWKVSAVRGTNQMHILCDTNAQGRIINLRPASLNVYIVVQNDCECTLQGVVPESDAKFCAVIHGLKADSVERL